MTSEPIDSKREGIVTAMAVPTRRVRAAGIILGLGLGGFFDGIVLHQLLQWHHMLTSAGFPPNSVENLQINTLADGLFHALTYVLTVVGLFLLWRAYAAGERPGSLAQLAGLLLLGWGLFNVVEGLLNHYLLGIHHVRDDVTGTTQALWDLGFLLWGAAMVVIGWWLSRRPAGQPPVSATYE
jgi:uncharacterized membrane protein